MVITATDTIDSVVEGKKLDSNLNAKEKSRVYQLPSSADNKIKGRSHKPLVKYGQKYYDMPPNLINQLALLYGTKEAPKNRGTAVNRLLPYLNGQASAPTQQQYDSNRLTFTKKTSLPKILYQLATKRVRSPVPRSSYFHNGKGEYAWE